LLPATATPIEDHLASLQPVSLELAHTSERRRRVRQLLAQYHYRGFNGAVGENVQYLARDVRGRELEVMAFGILCGVGRRTVTRSISFHGNTQKDWSADYKVFSRSPWEARALFHPILEQAIQGQKLPRIEASRMSKLQPVAMPLPLLMSPAWRP
jgi:hypothetical protein